MSLGPLLGCKNIQSDLSLLDLPRKIVGPIIEKCDEYAWASLRGTCRLFRTLTSEHMSEETAARRVFAHPDLYRSLREELRRSFHVAANALLKQPFLLYDRATPLSISTNLQMVKIALVTARLMNKSRLYRKICDEHPELSVGHLTEEVDMALQKLDHVFIREVDGELLPPTSEAWSIPSFMFRYFLPREGVNLALEANCIRYGGNSVIDNKDVMKAIVKYYPEVMQYASEALRACSDFALELVRVNPDVLLYMSDRVRLDGNLAVRMIQDPAGIGSDLLSLVHPSLQDDEDVVLAAIRCQKDQEHCLKHGRITESILHYASARLKSERGVVLEAVRKYGSALCEAIGYQDDEVIVMTALQTRNNELKRIQNEIAPFLMTPEFESCQRRSGTLLAYASAGLKDNERVVLCALSNTTENFRYASLRLQHDKLFCLRVLEKNKGAFEEFDLVMRRDPDIQKASVKEDECCVIL